MCTQNDSQVWDISVSLNCANTSFQNVTIAQAQQMLGQELSNVNTSVQTSNVNQEINSCNLDMPECLLRTVASSRILSQLVQ